MPVDVQFSLVDHLHSRTSEKTFHQNVDQKAAISILVSITRLAHPSLDPFRNNILHTAHIIAKVQKKSRLKTPPTLPISRCDAITTTACVPNSVKRENNPCTSIHVRQEPYSAGSSPYLIPVWFYLLRQPRAPISNGPTAMDADTSDRQALGTAGWE